MKSNWIIQGDIGCGKTTCHRTLLPTYLDFDGREHEGAGLEVFAISMEPGIAAALGRNLCGDPKPHSSVVHWNYIPTVAVGFDVIADYIRLANSVPVETLIKTTDPDKRNYKQAIALCDLTADFVCQGCNEHFGPIREWGEERAVFLDSLTGATKAFTQNVVGGKPIKSLPEYAVIMDLMEAFFDSFWGNTKCSAGLVAHIDRETNPVTGNSTITVHTIGQKLAPRLVKKPDEVITAHFTDGDYYWSTEPEQGTEVQKRRRLPFSPRIVPDFRKVFSENNDG